MASSIPDLNSLSEDNARLRRRVEELEREIARSARLGGASKVPEALGRSISEREALLAEAERTAHMGCWAWDVPEDRVVWSDELYRILDYDPESRAASSEAFFARIHPEDAERVRRKSREGVESGIAEQVDFRIQRRDGTTREVTMRASFLFDESERLQRAVGTVLDVTDSRRIAAETGRAHRLLEETQRLTHTGSWEVDRATGEVRWSPELYRILGEPETTVPSVDAFMRHVVEEHRDLTQKVTDRAWNTGTVLSAYECTIERGDGEHRRLRFSSGTVRDAEGQVTSLYGTVTDVTDRSKLEARVAQAQRMEAIGQLSGGIAHDFNNLLVVLLDAAERLRAGDPLEPCVRDIETATRSAATLTQRLLAFSRKAVVAPHVVDLRRIVEEIRPLVARTIGEGILTSFEYADEPCVTRVDRHQVHQVLLNLVVNSRDAMPRGGTLVVRTTTESVREGEVEDLEPGVYVVLSVSDTGVGMDRDTQRRIFEPFFTTKEIGKGTGLGLSMVYGSMKQCGGGVAVDSSPGVGTVFRLYFPRERSEESVAPRKPAVARAARVLLVEDDPAVRRSVEGMLRRAHYEVSSAANADQAEELWSGLGGAVDILATDVVMPGTHGNVLAGRLLARSPRLKVVLMTGYAELDIPEERYGARLRVLPKPFTSETLQQVISELLSTEVEQPEVTFPGGVG